MNEIAEQSAMVRQGGAEGEVRTGSTLVPRISVHAFLDNSANREAIDKACSDRRMVKVTCETFDGGVAAACTHYSGTPTPNMLIVEVSERREDAFAGLESLAEVCDPGTQVVVIGQLNDIEMYRDLLRQGICEYLVSPVQPVQVIETLATAYAEPDTQPMGKLHSFAGVKGGVGSSTIAHNVAWYIAEQLDEDVVILDLDLAFGTTGLDFNQEAGAGISEALADPDRLDDVLLERLLIKATDRLALFTAPAALDAGFDPSPQALEKVIDVAKANFAHVIVDLPHTWSGWTRGVLMASDEIVFSLQPDLACLRNGKNLFDHFTTQRPNDSPPRMVVNMAAAPKRPEIPIRELADAVGVEPTSVISYDSSLFGTAANNGQMVGELDAKNKNSEVLFQLAALITRHGEVATAEKETPFAPILAPFLAALKGQKKS